MNIVERRLSEIHPYENNPRKNDGAVEAVANSIAEFGFKVPIVIDRSGTIVTGHTRYKAADMLGMDTVPCIIADDLSEEQIKAFRLADNKVAEIAQWDFKLLDMELADILDIDMSEFGFDLSTSDDDGYYGDERERTSSQINLDEYDASRADGKWGMPIIEAVNYVPDDLISFNYMLSTKDRDKGIHFYIDDYQFERLWNSPRDYMDKLAEFPCCLSPDFSLYLEMPLAMQMWNIYRSRLIGQMMQDCGIIVIPTLSWSTKESFEFCFDGLEQDGTVSVSTIGVKNSDYSNGLWRDGMDEAMSRLSPSHVVVYGGDIGYDFGDCGVTYISNHNSDRFNGK